MTRVAPVAGVDLDLVAWRGVRVAVAAAAVAAADLASSLRVRLASSRKDASRCFSRRSARCARDNGSRPLPS